MTVLRTTTTKYCDPITFIGNHERETRFLNAYNLFIPVFIFYNLLFIFFKKESWANPISLQRHLFVVEATKFFIFFPIVLVLEKNGQVKLTGLLCYMAIIIQDFFKNKKM